MSIRDDVAVIGAGVTGMSIAWRLSEMGVRCTVYDAKGVGAGMTGVQPGGVRTQWSSELNCSLALESRQFYEEFDRLLKPEKDPELDECGYVFVASQADTLDELKRDVDLQQAAGVDSRMLTCEEIKGMVEGIDPEATLGGAYCGTDGYFNHPGAVIAGYANAAARNGVELETLEVTTVRQVQDGWSVSFANDSERLHSKVVVAAGADSTNILGALGDGLAISAEPRYLFYSKPTPPFLIRPLLIFIDEHLAVKHLADGSILASELTHDAEYESLAESDKRARLINSLQRSVPLLEYVRFPVMVEGTYDVTPDQQPVLGTVPDSEGLFVAAGMNGRGMMLSPAFSRLVSQAVVSSSNAEIPPELRAERFGADEALKGEARVI